MQRVRAAVPPPGEARPDWWITAELAKRVARRVGLDVGRQFDFGSASQIFDEMARLIPFMGGLSHERLDREGGLQWPCPTADHPGTPYLYADSFPRGLGRFVPAVQTAAAAELPDPDYPFVLNTGRLLYHWHGGTMTRRVEGLLELAPRLEVALHPADARRLGVETGDPIRVSSRRGDLDGFARLTEAVRPGAIFVPFVKLADSAANFLTNSAHDPSSKIPEYKVCAVRIEAIRAAVRAGRIAAARRPRQERDPHDVGSRDRAARAHEAHRGDRRRPRHRGGRARAVRQAQGQGRAVAHEAARGPPQRQVHRRDGHHPDAARRGQDDDDHRALDGAQPGGIADHRGHPAAVARAGLRHQGRRGGGRLCAGGPDGGLQPPS